MADLKILPQGSGKRRGAQLRRVRAHTWTAAKRAAFLEKLAETANVSAACRSVKMAVSGVNKLRQRDLAFAAAWSDALSSAYSKLELQMLERAMRGEKYRVAESGKASATMTAYSDRLAMTLLANHRARVDKTPAGTLEPIEAVRARILKRLDALADKLEREAAGQ